MSSAYIASLNRDREQAAAAMSAPALSLRQRFIDWHAGLPGVARHRAFAMAEIELALGTQGKYLSPVLLGLGWVRRRQWSGRGQYNRYWTPPAA
jgi:hypothetical protein